MTDIRNILENQNEVQYLTYYCIINDKDGSVKLNLATLSINKDYKFKDNNACLNSLTDILLKLKRSEKWALSKLEK